MALYAIGDIQGCYDTLQGLLRKIRVGSGDRLWVTGDLVNRGPKSLEVLRWAKAQGDRVQTVLGNHDLHFLARYAGLTKSKPHDTIEPILEAPDCDELADWLRSQPFVHVEENNILVHAGLLPFWSVDEALEWSHEANIALRGPRWIETLLFWRKWAKPWKEAKRPAERLAAAVQAMIFLRACSAEGELSDYAGPLENVPKGFRPWFEFPDRLAKHSNIVFGHWSDMGLKIRDTIIGIDSGCVWGNSLTGVRLSDRAIFQQAALDKNLPTRE